MPRTKTFGQKLAVGVAALMLLTLIVAAVAIVALRIVVAEKDRVIASNAVVLIEAERLTALNERTVSNVRAFVFSPEAHHVEVIEETDSDFAASLAHIRQKLDRDESVRQLEEAQRAREAQRTMIGQVLALRRSNAPNEALLAKLHELQPLRTTLRIAVEGLVRLESKHMQEATEASSAKASYATWFMVGFTLLAFAIVVPLAWLFTRSLTGQIGAAIHHISSSSTELQAAANQQATASKQQASAAAEVTTTIKELLATTRQIAESAQRVARVSEQTANAALGADETVQRANEGITAIKRQVALVVSHMVDLGKKSQQIGSILELINELAEQTNILSINATIEAAGAGDAGRRFAVVAEEIRKLADRVGGSTKDIRTLVEEIRAAANTTVMATEDGAKVVEAGTRQFGEVTATFRQIAGLVDTTTEAAREIELSTKQQTSAVEQVNVAITDVAQASRETESSSQQTLTTSSQLTLLAKQLANVVHLPANA